MVLKSILNKKGKSKFVDAINGTIKNIQLKQKFSRAKEEYVNDCIINGFKINLHEYDELYVASETKKYHGLVLTYLFLGNKYLRYI